MRAGCAPKRPRVVSETPWEEPNTPHYPALTVLWPWHVGCISPVQLSDSPKGTFVTTFEDSHRPEVTGCITTGWSDR